MGIGGRLRRSVSILLLAAPLLGACSTTYHFRPAELTHLDGYDVYNERTVPMVVGATRYGPVVGNVPVTDRPYRMVDYEGVPVDFSSQTEVFLRLRDSRRVGGRFEKIRVQDDVFSGRTLKGEDVHQPLREVAAAEMDLYSPGKTLLLTIGISVGVPAVALVAILAAIPRR